MEPTETVVAVSPGNAAVAPAVDATVHRKSFQLRALGRQKISYQSRQWFTNICCVSLCPLLMILIAASLGAFLKSLLDSQVVTKESLYCSKLSVMNSVNLPITNQNDPKNVFTTNDGIPGAQTNNISHFNFLSGSSFLTSSSLSALGIASIPCVRWFGQNYPYSEPYERNPNISVSVINPFPNFDSTFTAQPKGGWLNLANLQQTAVLLQAYQLRLNFLYTYDSSVDPKVLGQLEDAGTFTGFSIPLARNPAYRTANDTTGLLGTIENRIWFNASQSASSNFSLEAKIVPWYNKAEGNSEKAL
ncbi:hypothetical protein HK096_007684, partial [Nowakowskiella sp. JEL0078]